MIHVPFPDRKILDELRAYLPSAERAAAPTAQGFMDLDAALAAHADVLERLDWADARFTAARSRVGAIRHAGATDAPRLDQAAHAVQERLGHSTGATTPERLRLRGLGSRRTPFVVRAFREATSLRE